MNERGESGKAEVKQTELVMKPNVYYCRSSLLHEANAVNDGGSDVSRRLAELLVLNHERGDLRLDVEHLREEDRAARCIYVARQHFSEHVDNDARIVSRLAVCRADVPLDNARDGVEPLRNVLHPRDDNPAVSEVRAAGVEVADVLLPGGRVIERRVIKLDEVRCDLHVVGYLLTRHESNDQRKNGGG